MKLRQALFMAVSAISLVGFGTTAANATTIKIDQTAVGGTLKYDGTTTGALVGTDILFDYLKTDAGSQLTCPNTCKLNFSTGSFNSMTGGGKVYLFDGGGSFELSGKVVNGTTTLVSDTDTFLTGVFSGVQTFNKIGGGGSFTGDGNNTLDNAVAGYFGIGPDSPFTFINTTISLDKLDYNTNNGGFDGDVTDGDINITNVPEPKELGIFGLGLALIVGSLLYRRKNGADIG